MSTKNVINTYQPSIVLTLELVRPCRDFETLLSPGLFGKHDVKKKGHFLSPT